MANPPNPPPLPALCFACEATLNLAGFVTENVPLHLARMAAPVYQI
jgi:hypothetical protein